MPSMVLGASCKAVSWRTAMGANLDSLKSRHVCSPRVSLRRRRVSIVSNVGHKRHEKEPKSKVLARSKQYFDYTCRFYEQSMAGSASYQATHTHQKSPPRVSARHWILQGCLTFFRRPPSTSACARTQHGARQHLLPRHGMVEVNGNAYIVLVFPDQNSCKAVPEVQNLLPALYMKRYPRLRFYRCVTSMTRL